MNLFLKAIAVGAVASTSLVGNLYASSKIVYGQDNRRETFELGQNYQTLFKSTAGMIDTTELVPFGENVILPPNTLKDNLRVCETESYAKQLSAVSCSGFLVGPDLLVTAGHCISTQQECDQRSWVFDYAVKSDTQRADVMISKNSVYKCKRVVDANHQPHIVNAPDFSLIQLERVVEDRMPLNYNVTTPIALGESIYVVGHPSGLPTKFADGANVHANSHPMHFQTNLDTFGGNSGSSVFNAMTDEVEGILVKGGVDYLYDGQNNCRIVNTVANTPSGATNGEQVTRLSAISTLKYRNALIKAAALSDIEALNFILANIKDINIYDNDKNTALHYAAKLGLFEVTNLLLQHNVELNIKNLDGKTPLDLAIENNHQDIAQMIETLNKYNQRS